jgi:cytochrome P450
MNAQTPDSYDPFSSDPSGSYGAMRAERPVYLYDDGRHRFYALSRYIDVRRVLTERSQYSIKYGQMHTYEAGQGLTVDPPMHTTLRKLLDPLFSVKRVQLLASRLNEIAETLIDKIIAEKKADFYSDFAALYAVHVVAEILGVEPERKEDLRQWTARFAMGLTSGDGIMVQAANQSIADYFGGLMAKRRAAIAARAPVADDLITVFVTAKHPDGRPFAEQELMPNVILLLAGGIETNSFLLTNCLFRLLSERALWNRLCADPALAENAIEESLRFDSPVFGTFRTNNAPVTLHGVDIPAESKIQMLHASANRDPAVFEDPDRFSLDRDLLALRQTHLAFGGGIHSCIGKSLARLSASTALRAWASRVPTLEIAGKPERYKTALGGIAINNGLTSLPIRWSEARSQTNYRDR